MSGVPAKIISDGRITIPRNLRQKYNLEEGDWIRITIEPLDGDRKRLGGV